MFVYDVDYYCKNFLIHQIYIHLSMIYPYIFIWLWISIKEESIYNLKKKKRMAFNLPSYEIEWLRQFFFFIGTTFEERVRALTSPGYPSTHQIFKDAYHVPGTVLGMEDTVTNGYLYSQK